MDFLVVIIRLRTVRRELIKERDFFVMLKIALHTRRILNMAAFQATPSGRPIHETVFNNKVPTT
jgi:hypothetical protein